MKVEDYFAKIQIQSEMYPWMPLDKKTSITKDELVRSRQKFFFKKKIADYDL